MSISRIPTYQVVESRPALKQRLTTVLQEDGGPNDRIDTNGHIELSIPGGYSAADIRITEYTAAYPGGKFAVEPDGTTTFQEPGTTDDPGKVYVRTPDSKKTTPAWAEKLESDALKLIRYEGKIQDMDPVFGTVNVEDLGLIRFEVSDYTWDNNLESPQSPSLEERLHPGYYKLSETQAL